MYDFIVVGAGTAGCVLADRLSADPGNRVLLLEAGRDERRKEITIPAGWVKLFRSGCDWGYETEPNRGMDGRRLLVPRGRMLGGTSGMNAMMYVRGHRADFDGWAAAGNGGWSHAEVLPYFRRSEANARGASEHHGDAGPFHVADVREPNPLSVAFVRAADAAGIPRNTDFNGAEQEGVGFVQVNVRNGRRWSAADAFLRPAMKRRNLTVLTGVHATRVLVEGGRAVGVRFLRKGVEEAARVTGEVILACGAIDTPRLLLLSGIGPADELRRHGLHVVHDLPGVGRNLQDHPGGVLLARCAAPVSLLTAESPASLLRYLLFRRGMLASNGAEAIAMVRTRPELEAPDLELIHLPVVWRDEGLTPPEEHGYTIAAVLLQPRSRGRITLSSADPTAPPVIDTNHFSDPDGHDLRTVVEGLRLAREIAAHQPLAALTTGEIFPGPQAVTEEALGAAVRERGQTIYHPAGTCRMGVDAGSVVRPDLRVHGIQGLRVIDASVMPTLVRGHPQAAVLMIAEKGADLILGREPEPPAALPLPAPDAQAAVPGTAPGAGGEPPAVVPLPPLH